MKERPIPSKVGSIQIISFAYRSCNSALWVRRHFASPVFNRDHPLLSSFQSTPIQFTTSSCKRHKYYASGRGPKQPWRSHFNAIYRHCVAKHCRVTHNCVKNYCDLQLQNRISTSILLPVRRMLSVRKKACVLPSGMKSNVLDVFVNQDATRRHDPTAYKRGWSAGAQTRQLFN
jgi:hypothetical protein